MHLITLSKKENIWNGFSFPWLKVEVNYMSQAKGIPKNAKQMRFQYWRYKNKFGYCTAQKL